MAGTSSFALRLARPYLITALILGVAGITGWLLAEALQLNYVSTFLALGGAGLVLVGVIFLLLGAIVAVVALVRGRSS